jgi:hypothetical protein
LFGVDTFPVPSGHGPWAALRVVHRIICDPAEFSASPSFLVQIQCSLASGQLGFGWWRHVTEFAAASSIVVQHRSGQASV